jgi:hypothetical protein
MVRTFATMTDALCRLGSPSSAKAMAFAEAVRFSILEDAADSERMSTDENGAISPPTSESNRAISVEASLARAATSLGMTISSSAILGVMDAL